MSVKVGSAGYVVDSVIQYPQNNNKPEPRQSDGAERVEIKQDTKKESKPFRPVVPGDVAAHNVPQAPQPSVVVEGVDGEGSVVENRKAMELSAEAVKITVDDVNRRIAHQGARIEFSYHEKTGRYSFKVLDKDSGEVLREVPPEKSLDMVAKMFEMVGLIVDEKL